MADDSFEQSEASRRAKQHEQNHVDFNNELAGANTGRMDRFVGAQTQETKAQEKEKRQRSALETLLQDEAYFAAWTNTINALNEADQAVYDAMMLANDNLVAAQKEHKDLQNEASHEKLEHAEERYDQVQEHELRLAEIREEIEDDNTPVTLERLGELTQQVQDITADVTAQPDSKNELEIKHISHALVPDLAL